jgi:hypothetical protein
MWAAERTAAPQPVSCARPGVGGIGSVGSVDTVHGVCSTQGRSGRKWAVAA